MKKGFGVYVDKKQNSAYRIIMDGTSGGEGEETKRNGEPWEPEFYLPWLFRSIMSRIVSFSIQSEK